MNKENVIDWGYTMEEVKEHLTQLHPSTVWEKIINKIDGKEYPQISGDVFDLSGRFSFMIGIHPTTFLGITPFQTKECLLVTQPRL